jgi:hypothetical protein
VVGGVGNVDLAGFVVCGDEAAGGNRHFVARSDLFEFREDERQLTRARTAPREAFSEAVALRGLDGRAEKQGEDGPDERD